MKQIINNPYRTIGVLVGVTAREQEKQIRRLKQFIEAEQEPQDDFSFPTLGKLHRTVDSVSEAASKLNLDSDKINAAIFWFYNGSHTDEPAFNAIKEGDLDQVLNIWSKLTSSPEVTQRNASAYNNLSTLYLSGILEGTNTNEAILEQGISLKLKFLESDFIKDFKELATDATFKTTKKDLQILFLNQIQSELDNRGGITSQKFLDILNKQTFSAKGDFLKGFVQKPIEQIEKKVTDSRAKRKANASNANNIGLILYESTRDSLSQLKSILGISDLKYSSIADKVSDEILQCGIDYFKHYKDSNTDPGGVTSDLFKKAKSLAVGSIAKQRSQENTENLNEWIEEKPDREKQGKVINDLEKLKALIDEYDKMSETVSNAKQLLSSAIPYLSRVKGVLGSSDDLYLGFSSRIASDAQGMIVSEINKLQEKFTSTYDSATKLAAIHLLKQRIEEAWWVTDTIGDMDLKSDFRTRFNSNRNSLSNLRTQLNAVSSNKSSGKSSGGCYIATMAYGDYEHPQVMILRGFRDNVLSKSFVGRVFIKIYYYYSPKLVEKLKDHKRTNQLIRTGLNQIIKLIK